MSSDVKLNRLAPGMEEVALPVEEPGGEPLSCAQQRLWFLSRLDPESALYNVPSAVRFRGALDIAALERGLRVILDRHEILRTTYAFRNGRPVQQIQRSCRVDLPVIDLAPLEDREAKLAQTLEAEAARPFDLERDAMARFRLFRIAADDHVLFINIHHIACDEWSISALFHELGLLYEGFARGESAVLPELPIQYADFACWQQDWIKSGAIDPHLSYWKQRLAAANTVLALPADRMRSSSIKAAGDRVHLPLPAELSAAAKAFARREGVTPFIFLMTIFKVLLVRYTSEREILIGTPISGRNRIETESLVGFFVNMLTLRTEFPAGLTFRQAMDRTRKTVLGAFAHQEVPFEKLVEELRPERNAAQNPFFNIIFALHNAPPPVRIEGLETTVLDVYNHTSKFDLNLTVEDGGGTLRLIAEYNSEIFSRSRIARFLEHFQHLLAAAIGEPDQGIDRLPLLDPAQRHRALIDWNQTATDYPRNRCVHELFQDQAARTPDSIAVHFEDGELTYGELNARGNRLARHLRALGVKPGTPVGLCLERSAEMLVGVVGILKAGGAYLPLDPAYPVERITFMARDAGIPLVVTGKRVADRLSFPCPVVCLDRDQEKIYQESPEDLPVVNDAGDIAYVIYTSGSTGLPKGICIPHRAVNRLVFNTNYIEFGPSERIAQISNASFDAATFEIWGSLLFGGQLIGFNRETILSPAAMAECLEEKKISSLFLTVALFNQIAAERPDAFRSVKNLLVGGDALDPAAIRRVLRFGPPRRLVNGYGPTECTTFALTHLIESVEENATSIPIGRPISNTRAYILDRLGEPVPVGITGELYLGGDGLAIGYLNRPELNREKFVPDPFLPGERLYRTGDLARYREDGVVEFLGRVDYQVKIRGYRIEPGEIETALSQEPGIREAVVVVRQDTPGEKRLVAYLGVDASSFSAAELRERLKGRMPDYMIPSAFVFLPKLPLTPNGKVDRRALPPPEQPRMEAEENLPRNNIELALVKVWERVLGVRPVGIHDNFFDLGGHSLLAVKLFDEIEKAVSVKLPLPVLFQAPTIEKLAGVIREQGWTADGAALVEIQPAGSKPPIFWLHTLGGGGGGGLFTYHKLAQLLGPDQPSYGFIAPAQPHTRLETMAEHYIEEMRRVQPHGPYYLGGYCFGGVIAFEMARQLTLRGDTVAMLALLESIPPNVDLRRRALSGEFASQLFKNLPSWIFQSLKRPGQLASRLRRKIFSILRPIWTSAEKPSEALKVKGIDLRDVIDMQNYPKDFKRYAEIHWNALVQYIPQAYPGRVTLFRTETHRLWSFDPELRWKRLAAEVDVRIIPGAHEDILDYPHVRALAVRLQECLATRHEKAGTGRPVALAG